MRIGAGQGFYGDSADGAIEVARSGGVSYICCDALAELTMAILQKDRVRDPALGYARDLPGLLRPLLPICREAGIRVITNAGGMNPMGAAARVRDLTDDMGMGDLRIATVVGDDLTGRIDALRTAGAPLRHLNNGDDLDPIRDRIVFAVAYLGARPIVEALAGGADIVITGRVADASLFVAPLVHELGWSWEDWDRLAAGVVVGHLMECSGQSTGGNFSGDWWNIDLDRLGYPVAEVFEDGRALLTKPVGTGGRVSVDTAKEQLLYEVLDPRAYANPDVVADFTSVVLRDVAPDVVEITGVTGRPRTADLKVILGYLDGWAGTASVGWSWPDAVAKARRGAELIDALIARHGLTPTERIVELVGVDSAHGDAAPIDPDANEVTLRYSCRFPDERQATAFPRLVTQLGLNGPPFVAGGLPPQRGRALLGVWPALVPRTAVEPHVEVQITPAVGAGAR